MAIFVKRDFPKIKKRNIASSDPAIKTLFGGTDTDLPAMSPRIAVGIPAVYTCVDIKSSDIAMLPRHLFKRTKEGRERVTDDDQLFLIKTQPNEHMNAYDFWRLLLIDKYLWGNGYALKEINEHGRAVSYTILKPYEVDVYQDDRTGQVVYTNLKNQKVYPPDRIIHLKGFTFDGLKGISVVTLARLAFQKGISLDKFAAHFYHNKTNLAGWIEYQDWFEDDEQMDKLLETWNRKYRGYGKSDVAVLAGGTKYHSITMPMSDAQFIENQKFTLEQIAMLFRIPPTRLGFLDNANRSNMEGTFLEYATYTLQSECVQIEQELNIKIVRPSQKNTHYWKLEIKALLRGDHKSMAEWINTMINRGIMTPNEIRALEDLNPIPEGNRILLPMNMIYADRMDEYIDSIVQKAIRQLQTSQNGTGTKTDVAEILGTRDN